MDYSKIESGITSIVEALKENTSVINGGVEYSGISDMLHGQSDIMKNFLQGSFSADMRVDMKKLALEASTGQGQAEATTDLVGTINGLRDLIGATFESEEISSENIASNIDASEIADHLANDLEIDTSDISINIDAEDVARHLAIDAEDIAQHIEIDTSNVNVDRLGVDIFKRLDELEGSLREKVSSEITAHTRELQSILWEINERVRVLPTESEVKEYVNEARRETDEKLERIESAIRNEINEAFKMCALNRQAPLQLPLKEVEVPEEEDKDKDEPLVQFVKALDHLGIMGTEAMYELRRMTVYLEELVERKQKGEIGLITQEDVDNYNSVKDDRE
tara:strand:- start:580 stop:1590 length:1011 start_codon:yes stop_codon:yes gene_type:complete